MAKPSYVEVPLPSSSIITREFLVASFTMLRVSCISTKKVDFFSIILSLAPILVNILSTGDKINPEHGTKHPN